MSGEAPSTGSPFWLRNVAAVVIVVGLAITGLAAWSAHVVDRHNEHRLLELQTRQAAAVITSSVIGIGDPLSGALKIAEATGGDPVQIRRYLSAYVGPSDLFVSVTVTSPSSETDVGEAPALTARSAQRTALLAKATTTRTFVVSTVASGTVQRIAYAQTDTAHAYTIYAERAIPANRRVPSESGSAFADLDFATYVGRPIDMTDLATTDLPLSRLPIHGDVATAVVPFGDSTITIVTTPRHHLGGSATASLVWVRLAAGLVITFATAGAAHQLVRRGIRAENDAATISDLYSRLDGLYSEQREISETLQRALLPPYNPEIPTVELATRYVAGAVGVDVGGDWYSVIPIDDDHFGFAVGDVSGRGVSAASVMGRLQFTMRAYLREGHSPERVLTMCAQEIDIVRDGHFATAVVGVGNASTRTLTLANAGHVPPLLISADGTSYVAEASQPPLGTTATPYTAQSVAMPPGSTLLVYTDGLVERRDEGIDAGMARLAAQARQPGPQLDSWLEELLDAVTLSDAQDDVAIVALRWR